MDIDTLLSLVNTHNAITAGFCVVAFAMVVNIIKNGFRFLALAAFAAAVMGCYFHLNP